MVKPFKKNQKDNETGVVASYEIEGIITRKNGKIERFTEKIEPKKIEGGKK